MRQPKKLEVIALDLYDTQKFKNIVILSNYTLGLHKQNIKFNTEVRLYTIPFMCLHSYDFFGQVYQKVVWSTPFFMQRLLKKESQLLDPFLFFQRWERMKHINYALMPLIAMLADQKKLQRVAVEKYNLEKENKIIAKRFVSFRKPKIRSVVKFHQKNQLPNPLKISYMIFINTNLQARIYRRILIEVGRDNYKISLSFKRLLYQIKKHGQIDYQGSTAAVQFKFFTLCNNTIVAYKNSCFYSSDTL
jgi:hypothetical protein